MATVKWNGAGSSNYWNDVNNWDTTTQPTSSDDVLFNITSSKDCSVNLSPYVNSLTCTSDYTGSWVMTGYDFTSNGSVLFDKSGALTLGTGLYLKGDGTFRLGSGLGTVTATSCNLRLDGTLGSYIIPNKASTFKSLVFGPDVTTTLDGAVTLNLASNSTVLTFVKDGSFSINSAFIMTVSGSCNAIDKTGSPVINGNTGFTLGVNAADATVGIPAITYSGSGACMYRGAGAYTGMAVNFFGDQSFAGSIFRLRNDAAGSITFNTNDYTVSVPSFTIGNNQSDSTTTLNFGSSTVTCTQRNPTSIGKTYINLQSSKWYTGTWNTDVGDIINPGTSTLTFNRNSNFTSNDQTFFNINVNATTTAQDKIAIADGGKLTVNAPFTLFPTTSSQVLNFLGAYTFDGTGSVTIKNGGNTDISVPALDGSCTGLLTFDTTDASSSVNFLGPIAWNGSISFTNLPSSSIIDVPLTLRGNDTTLSTPGILRATHTCDLTANGLRTVLYDTKGVTLRKLTIGPGASLLTNGTIRTIFTGSSNALYFGSDSKLTNNAALLFLYSTSGTSHTTTGDYTWNGTGGVDFALSSNNLSLNVNPINYTGSGTLSIRNSGTSLGSTFNFLGDISCATLNLSSNTTVADMTYNMGSYNYSISSFNSDSNGLNHVNLQASNFYCRGNWYFDTDVTVSPGTSSVNILNTSTLTPNKGIFFNLNLSAGAGIITVPGTLNIANGGSLSIDSTLNINPTVSSAIPNFLGSYTLDGTGKVTIGGSTANLSHTVPGFNLPDSSWVISPANDSTVTFTGDTTVGGLTVNKGLFLIPGKNLVSYGSVLFDSSNAGLTLGKGLYFKRDCTCRIGADLVQPLSTSNTRVFVDTTVRMNWIHNKGVALKTLTIGKDSTFINSGVTTNNLRDTSSPLVFVDGGRLTLNRAIALTLDAPDYIIKYLGRQPIFDGTANMSMSLVGDGTFTFPAFTNLSTGNPLYLNQSGVQTNSVLNFVGDYSWAAASIYMYATGNGAPNSQAIVNTNNYNMTFNFINWGSAAADTTLTMNCGSSTLTGFFTGNQNDCDCTLNLQNCTWNVDSAGWEIDPIHTINPGTSTVNMLGNYSGSYLRNKGKSLYNLNTKMAPTRTVTIDSIGIANGGTFRVNSPVLFSNTAPTNVLTFLGSYTFDGTSAITIGGTSDSTISAFNHTGTSDWTVSPPDSSGVCFLGDSTFNSLRVTKGNFRAFGGLRSNKSVFFDNTGNLTLGPSLYLAGDGTCRFGSALGAVDVTSCVLQLDGTAVNSLAVDKFSTLKGLKVGSGANLVVNGSSTSLNITGPEPLVFVNGGSLKFNSVQRFIVSLTSTGDFIKFLGANPSIINNNTSNYTFFQTQGSNITASIPPLTITGTGTIGFYFRDNGSVNTTINLTGDISSTCPISFGLSATSGSGSINTNNKNIALSTTNGKIIEIGFSQASGSPTHSINFGNSVVSLNSVNFSSTNQVGNINLQTSRWSCGGNWTFGSNHIVDPGTSQVTFMDTTTATIVSAGKSFYDITVNNPFKAFTFSDPVSCHNLTVSAAASYSHSATTLTASGNVLFDSTGTLNLGNNITLNGNASTLRFGSTLGAATGTSCTVTMNGASGAIIEDNKGYILRALVLGANADVTNNGTVNTTYSSSATPLTFNNSGTLTLNRAAIFNTTGSVPLVSIVSGTPIIKGSAIVLRAATNPNFQTIPAMVIDTTSTTISSLSSTPTISLAGNLTCRNLIFSASGASTLLTINTGNYDVSCQTFTVGGLSSGSLVTNYGSSKVTCTAYDSTSNTAGVSTIQNFQSSQWACSGNWAFKSDHTVSHIWDTVTFTSDSTITSAGKPFNNLVINSPDKTVVLADPLVARGYQVIRGSVNAGTNLRIRPDTVVTTDILPY